MTQHKVQQSKRFLENTRVQDKTSESINDSLRVKLQRRFVVVKYLYPLQNVLRRSKRKIIHIFSKWKFHWEHFLNKKETYNLEKMSHHLMRFIIYYWWKCKGWCIKGIVIFVKNKQRYSSYTQIRKTHQIFYIKKFKSWVQLGTEEEINLMTSSSCLSHARHIFETKDLGQGLTCSHRFISISLTLVYQLSNSAHI